MSSSDKILRLNVIGYFKDSFWYVGTQGLKAPFKAEQVQCAFETAGNAHLCKK